MAGTSNGGTLSLLSEDEKLKNLENIEVKLTVEAGAAHLSVKDLLNLRVGSVVELNTLAGAHLNVRANGTFILKGEIVKIAEMLGIRITAIASKDERATDQI